MILNPLFPNFIIWLLLGLAVIAMLLKLRFGWVLFALSLVCALIMSRVTLIGAGLAIIGFAFAFALSPLAPKKVRDGLSSSVRALLQVGLVTWCIVLAIHVMPGFHNLLVLDDVVSGPKSMPFTLYLNLDKPLIIFALLLAFPKMLETSQLKLSGTGEGVAVAGISGLQWLILAVCLALIAGLAMASSYIKPEFSIPDWWWIFAFNNLLFTCVAEEVFFRGYLQNTIVRHTNIWVGLGLASIIFGIAHFAGGPGFMLLACLAGVLYGLTYIFSGRLIAAVLMHFTLNMAHLVFFTYPVALL